MPESPQNEEQELKRLRQLLSNEQDWRIYQEIKDFFMTLYTRSQVFFGLIAITLTITGFSGPAIARSNEFSRLILGLGIFLVLLSAVTFALGPLRIEWISRMREQEIDAVFIAALRRKNRRTRYYRASIWILTVGLFCYVSALIGFLVAGG